VLQQLRWRNPPVHPEDISPRQALEALSALTYRNDSTRGDVLGVYYDDLQIRLKGALLKTIIQDHHLCPPCDSDLGSFSAVWRRIDTDTFFREHAQLITEIRRGAVDVGRSDPLSSAYSLVPT
jgi:hypothetical protein